MLSELHKRTKYTAFSKRPASWVVIFAIIAGMSLVYSRTASANWQSGLFSFVDNLISANQASANIPAPDSAGTNSQTMSILVAVANTDSNPDNLPTLPPFDDNTLVPELASANAIGTDALNTQISTYVVREGDTLSLIAKMFDVSVNTIVWANNLGGSKSKLTVGQTLVILPVSGIRYTVVKGDTVSGIVKKYKADVDEVSRYNDITPSSPLAVGQVIIIPDAELSVQSGGSLSPAPGGSLPAYSGYYIRPLAGGYRSQGIHGHNAVDLAGIPVGTPIRAAADGTVIISRIDGAWNGAYGNYIVISHPNNTQTLYAHMSPASVGVVALGQHVDQGQTIGYVGMTGKTTGPHVHFEIRGARNPF
jgi:murein DD-endopeptidase MepM/ murein hydrolase activator NlpD